MKRFFKFLFNVIRNISLIIVLLLLGAIVYTYYTGELQEAWEQVKIEEALKKEETYSEEMNQEEAFYKEEKEIAFDDKIQLQAPKATYFIRPAETAFFGVNDNSYAIMSTGDKVNGIRSSLIKIWEILDRQETNSFFQTRDALINCRFVRQYYSENISMTGTNYVHRVIMETGDTLVIPHAKYKAFKKKMEACALILE